MPFFFIFFSTRFLYILFFIPSIGICFSFIDCIKLYKYVYPKDIILWNLILYNYMYCSIDLIYFHGIAIVGEDFIGHIVYAILYGDELY